jgi:hypothetical protein
VNAISLPGFGAADESASDFSQEDRDITALFL